MTARPPLARLLAGLALVLPAVGAGCGPGRRAEGPKYEARTSRSAPVHRLAVHPLHNPAMLLGRYQPLLGLLNARLDGFTVELEASRDYGTFEAKFRARQPEWLLPNPWQTLEAMKSGYTVIAMAGEPEDFRGIVVVRRDSGIAVPSDLKGKAVSYPSPTALAACIMVQDFLHAHGVDVNRDIENRYVGSQESSVMNAFLGASAAGATWPPPWRAFQKDHPAEAAQMKVVWETPSLINNSVMARGDLPPKVREQVRSFLVGLHETPEGRAVLAGIDTRRFLPANDADYEVVRSYVARFEREVRKVESR